MINIFIAISIAVCWHFGMIDAVSGEVAGELGDAIRSKIGGKVVGKIGSKVNVFGVEWRDGVPWSSRF